MFEQSKSFPKLVGLSALLIGGSAVVDLTYVENFFDSLLASITAPDLCCGKKRAPLLEEGGGP